jgi:hypothetical protein
VGNAVEASALVETLARLGGFSAALVDRIFEGVPRDFPVFFGPHLPLRADRFGMAGITIGGRVYLRDEVRDYSPGELLRLLRHEAEHVRQQRSDRLFYLRYGWQWLLGMGRALPSVGRTGLASAAQAAYLAIEAEREAYAADAVTRRLLRAERDLS